MKRRISTILISSGTILLLLGMLLSTVSFAARGAAPQDSARGAPEPRPSGTALCDVPQCPSDNLPANICCWGATPCCGLEPGWDAILHTNGVDCKECAATEPPAGQEGVHCDMGTQWHPCGSTPCTTDADCDNGVYCDGEEKCHTKGYCVAGTPVDCSDLNDQCNVGVCNEDQEQCVKQPANEGGACDDLDPCTEPDVCTAGVCGGPWICGECQTDLDCDDDNVCTDDICEVDYTCSHTNNAASCDDGDACTENDTCSEGVCAGTPKDCSHLNEECKVGVCNASTGVCEAQNKDDGTSCNDDDPCTDPDVCTAGVCGGPWICPCKTDADCDDGNICTDDICEADYTCSYTNNTDPCDDGKFCTENDVCAGGVCAGTAISCDDGDICTDDSCDEASNACVHVFDASNDPSCVTICENAAITVQVTECGAGVAGLSVELHSSYGDVYGPKTSPATFSVIGGSDRLWYAIVNGARMGATIKVTQCGGTGTIDVVLPCVPTPTPVVEVLGVERLPTTGEMPLGPAFSTLPMILSSLTLIGSGLLLRRKE